MIQAPKSSIHKINAHEKASLIVNVVFINPVEF